MELKIEKQNENKLLNRLEIEFYAMGDGTTPSRRDVKTAIQQKLKVDEELIVIDKIESHFGMSQVNGKAMVYNDKKSMDVVPEYLLKRDRKKQAEKKESPKEEKKEAPKEDEAKPEEKSKGEKPKKEEKSGESSSENKEEKAEVKNE
ncbi:MAG: hypothetical protein ABIG39_00395 [Candidatus Micrarchaeota archaeon]